MDTALLALELKRHERRRKMMRHGGLFRPEAEEAKKMEEKRERTRTAEARETRDKLRDGRTSSKEQNHFSKDLEQWIKKVC